MSTWIPPAIPPVLEPLWLPLGHSDVSITPHAVSALEAALDKSREDVRKTAAPIPIGVMEQALQSADNAPTQIVPSDDVVDDGMEIDEDIDNDEMLSDGQSGDGEFGTVGSASLHSDEHVGDDDSDDDDDLDDLGAYL